MNKKNRTIKKVLAITIATNMIFGSTNILKTETVASAWWWNQKKSQEEIDSVYEENKQSLDSCLDLSNKLNDQEIAQSLIKDFLQLKDECESSEKSYEKAIEIKNEIKELQNELNIQLNLQEIENRKKIEEKIRQIEEARVYLSEQLFSLKRKIRQSVEFQENLDHLNSIINEIDEKIQVIDNLGRIPNIETLITELQSELENVLKTEAESKRKLFEKNLNEKKSLLFSKVEELNVLLSELNSDNENSEKIKNLVEDFKNSINNLWNLQDSDNLVSEFENLKSQIKILLEEKEKKEAQEKALQELEEMIENLRDPQVQLEMLSEGKITLDDVIGGNQKAKTKALALIKAFEKFNNGGKFVPSKGLLFYGPPGTGKTSLVKAFAAEQGLETFIITPSLVMGDNGERKVLEIIEQAKKAAQISGKLVILLIDEIDAVAQKRSSSSSDKVLVMLMNEIDKLTPRDNVVVFATTNRREALDSAIIRSGRLDQSVEVGLPNTEAKEKIVKIYLKNIKVAEGLNMKSFVDKMRGFSGADIKRVIDIAINSAMDRQKVTKLCDVIITNADIQEGIATIMDEKINVY